VVRTLVQRGFCGWCREGEFIFWRADFSSVMGKFALINDFRVSEGAFLA